MAGAALPACAGERLVSAHASENAIFGFDSVPFLATAFEAPEKLRAVARPMNEKVLDEQNLVLLYAVPWPPQGLDFKKDVNAVGEMRRLFRTWKQPFYVRSCFGGS